MVFFGAMPFIIGLMNFAVPLQLGVRDVAFPTLKLGQLLADRHRGLARQHVAGHRRVLAHGLAALSAAERTQIFARRRRRLLSLGHSDLQHRHPAVGRVNLTTTILKMRAPGMSYLRMPMFCWTSLASNLLIVAAFPILTATLAMLTLDRYLGFHFFTDEAGGKLDDVHEPRLGLGASGSLHPRASLLWRVLRGHLDVLGQNRCSGYRSMVVATMAIFVLAFMVMAASLLHHGGGWRRQRRVRHPRR